jgi:redox-sensing transcriptional repressor
MTGDSSAALVLSIPESTVLRLPVYQRILVNVQSRGLSTISSADLGRLSGENAASVRRDLSRLGSLGTRGTGYNVATLIRQIDRVFATSEPHGVVLVGAGNLGRALVHSNNFFGHGAELEAVFDADPILVGTELGGCTVLADELLEQTVAQAHVHLAVLTVPVHAAESLASRLVASGIRSILNFAPTTLHVGKEVTVRYVDLSIELQALSFSARDNAARSSGPSIGTAGITNSAHTRSRRTRRTGVEPR